MSPAGSKAGVLAAALLAGWSAAQEPTLRFERQPLDMTIRNGATGNKHQVETMPAGVAVLDFDSDGWPDIFIANGASVPGLEKPDPSFHNRLFRNNRDGTFRDVTAQAGVAGQGYSMGAAAGDYDNDGSVDLFVAGVGANTLYRNRGDGRFDDVTDRAMLRGDGTWSIAAGWFDYDNDGRLDLFVARYVAWDPSKEPYCGLPESRAYCHPRYYRPLANALYRNNGDGTFRDVSAETGIAMHAGKGMGVAFGDADGDGFLDVAVANDTMPNFLFRNGGKGKFREVGVEAGMAYNTDGQASSFMGADFRDYDNDGREDVFVTALAGETFSLFRNLGGARFVDMSSPSRITPLSRPLGGWSTGMFDFNNDGWKDIFVAAGGLMDASEVMSGRQSRQRNSVFLNNGDGTFRVETLPGEAVHRGAAFGDFDRDGRVDAVVTQLDGQPFVLRNQSRARHWIGFRLTGGRSTRDGIGARIHIVTEAGHQWNRVTTSTGYAASSDRVAHFGLGSAEEIRLAEIEWPSGLRQKLGPLAIDKYHEVRELVRELVRRE